MRRYILKTATILAIVFLTGCKDENLSLSKQFSNKEQFNAKARILPFKKKIFGNPSSLNVRDSLLFFEDQQNNKYFSVIDLKNKKPLKRFGNKGHGPNEILDPTFLNINKENNRLEFRTMNTHKFYSLPIDSIIQDNKIKINKYKVFDYIHNNNISPDKIISFKDKYLAIGFIEKGKYAFLNEKGNTDTIFGKYSVATEHEYLDGFQKSLAYQGRYVKNPFKSQICYASSANDFMEILSIKDDKFNYKKRHGSYYPNIKIHNNGRISTSTMSPFGFLDISATSDYIYALFSGRTFNEYGGNFGRGETVYVFDWNLTPVCSYILEYDTNSITVCEKNKKMYAFGITEDNKVKLLKYLLKH